MSRWMPEGGSVKKNEAKKPFVTKASKNHSSETHITKVYTSSALTRYKLRCCNSTPVLRESIIISRTEKC